VYPKIVSIAERSIKYEENLLALKTFNQMRYIMMLRIKAAAAK
jgi:hypothetical protein